MYAVYCKQSIVQLNCMRVKLQASNPGQFDNESDAPWNKGPAQDSIYHVVRIPYAPSPVSDIYADLQT